MKQAAVSITILADNTAVLPYREEHGFSAFVEVKGLDGQASGTLLFDTGRIVLFGNAVNADVDLAQAQFVVISHGHYDHSDALPSLLEKYPSIRVCASDKVFSPHYSRKTGTGRSISLSIASREVLRSLPQNQLITFTDSLTVSNGLISLVGNIERNHPLEKPGTFLFKDPECTVPDPVDDEIALCINTPNGLVILTGCCHAGFINTCEYAKKVSGKRPIYAIIGGFHLSGTDQLSLESICVYIRENNIKKVIPCHCTGSEAVRYLETTLGEIVLKGSCGMRFNT